MERNRDSSVGVAMGYGLVGGDPFPTGSNYIILATVSVLDLGLTQPPIELVPGILSPWIKRPRRETDHILQYSAKERNGGVLPPLPYKF
jgi:hypothetical protein